LSNSLEQILLQKKGSRIHFEGYRYFCIKDIEPIHITHLEIFSIFNLENNLNFQFSIIFRLKKLMKKHIFQETLVFLLVWITSKRFFGGKTSKNQHAGTSNEQP